MIARREDDAFHPVVTGSLEDVVATDDVGLQDVLPWPFNRVAAEVHDRVDAFGDTRHRPWIRNICGLEALVGRKILDRANVREPHAIFARKLTPQMSADPASGTSDQYRLHLASHTAE